MKDSELKILKSFFKSLEPRLSNAHRNEIFRNIAAPKIVQRMQHIHNTFLNNIYRIAA